MSYSARWAGAPAVMASLTTTHAYALVDRGAFRRRVAGNVMFEFRLDSSNMPGLIEYMAQQPGTQAAAGSWQARRPAGTQACAGRQASR